MPPDHQSSSLNKLLRSMEDFIALGGLPTTTLIRYWLDLVRKAIGERDESS